MRRTEQIRTRAIIQDTRGRVEALEKARGAQMLIAAGAALATGVVQHAYAYGAADKGSVCDVQVLSSGGEPTGIYVYGAIWRGGLAQPGDVVSLQIRDDGTAEILGGGGGTAAAASYTQVSGIAVYLGWGGAVL